MVILRPLRGANKYRSMGAPAMAPQDLYAMLARRRLGRSKIDEVGRNGRLVPLQAETGEIGNVNMASLDLVGLRKDWIRPILPFQPMRRLGDAHDVRGDLGV